MPCSNIKRCVCESAACVSVTQQSAMYTHTHTTKNYNNCDFAWRAQLREQLHSNKATTNMPKTYTHTHMQVLLAKRARSERGSDRVCLCVRDECVAQVTKIINALWTGHSFMLQNHAHTNTHTCTFPCMYIHTYVCVLVNSSKSTDIVCQCWRAYEKRATHTHCFVLLPTSDGAFLPPFAPFLPLSACLCPPLLPLYSSFAPLCLPLLHFGCCAFCAAPTFATFFNLFASVLLHFRCLCCSFDCPLTLSLSHSLSYSEREEAVECKQQVNLGIE